MSIVAVIWFWISDLFGLNPAKWKIQYWWAFLAVFGQIVAIILWLTPWIEQKLYFKAENMIKKLKLSEEIQALMEKKMTLQGEVISLDSKQVQKEY